MDDLKNLLWVASYPKSGNTWMRAILTSLFYSDDGIFDFKFLPKIDQFEKLQYFDFVKDINIDDYRKLNELPTISKYWAEAQIRIKSKELIFFKTHSCNYSHNNLNYTNQLKTRGGIYIIRDPRDVAVSYSKFIGESADMTIDYMLGQSRQIWNQNKSLGIILSRWDYHVSSWLNLNAPIMFIRYEDLLDKTEKILNELINFLTEELKIKIDVNQNKINNIIQSTSFNLLKKKEEKEGFREASKSSAFFREGKSMQWKNDLNQKQISKIETNFSEAMKKFNYK
ncbi:sulfotransferase domain-containing protein [Alphaproteobacteria bacterium]|nr:sulfotransferase domain-containing protein [Alphaproteobacteria bacterium]